MKKKFFHFFHFLKFLSFDHISYFRVFGLFCAILRISRNLGSSDGFRYLVVVGGFLVKKIFFCVSGIFLCF